MDSPATEPKWQALSRNERRVIGVLVEKAKTTPQQYPLTLNSLVTGSNQKSNRAPLLDLDEEQVDDALEQLRLAGACVEVQGDARAAKYRHTMYEWLGVDKVELAVMTELLLRGEQTIGELRGRAARMNPIDSVAALRPILDALSARKLILYLTPQGRGCLVTHNLYQPRELEKIFAKHGTPPGGFAPGAGEVAPPRTAAVAYEEETTAAAPPPAAAPVPTPTPAPAPAPAPVAAEPLQVSNDELEDLRAEVRQLKQELAETRGELENSVAELRGNLDDISRQLGI